MCSRSNIFTYISLMGQFTSERDGALLIISLDNPDRGNALGAEAALGIAELFDEASLGTGDVRAVLLRANGKHFCTGADISGNNRGDAARPIVGHMVRSLTRTHHRLVESVFNCRVPTVAAVPGNAQAFGLNLALATDFIVAAERSKFSEPFVERGFSVDSGGSWMLPRLVGMTRAKQMLFLSDLIDSATALQWGLVHQVVPDNEVDATARGLADRLAARPTAAIAATKQLVHDGAGYDLKAAMHAESMAVELTIRSNDFKEGMNAFFKKRPPEFTGT
jgi:2-(1,2-epoxy-1,2-dihydrophenyl)acetyl-CoA isomerase